jgi:hypothetical protein
VKVLLDTLPEINGGRDSVRVKHTEGYIAADLPADIKSAILLQVNGLYDKRAAEAKRYTSSSEAILKAHKKYTVL